MAGSPSSFVPSPVTSSKTNHRFTVEQANNSLPLVSRIVRDIVAAHAEVAQQQRVTPAGKKQQVKPTAQVDPAELNRKLERLQTFVEELTALGVELKDFETGLIDFVGRHKGHDVCLCWKLNEPKIGFWHELDAGFAGRQPIETIEED